MWQRMKKKVKTNKYSLDDAVLRIYLILLRLTAFELLTSLSEVV